MRQRARGVGFRLSGFEFGFDPDQTYLRIEDGVLSLELRGAKESVERAWEHPEWPHLLYPPLFYLHGCAVDTSCDELELRPISDGSTECALYVLEHFTVEDCVVLISPAQVEVRGRIPAGLQPYPVELEVLWPRDQGLPHNNKLQRTAGRPPAAE